jgi:hypothetical protein
VALASPLPAAYEPAGAGVQAMAPAALLYVPAGHSVALMLPAPETNEPAGAFVQAMAPAALL